MELHFVAWAKYYRVFETFLVPFLSPLDLVLLKLTANSIRCLIPTPQVHSRRMPLVNVAFNGGYFRFALWGIDHKLYHHIGITTRGCCMKATCEEEEIVQKKLLQYFFSPRNPFPYSFLLQMKNTNMIHWVLEKGYIFDNNVASMAARGGDLNLLKFLLTWKCNMDNVCEEAAFHGHWEIIKWTQEPENKGIFLWKNACAVAALQGHFEILKWAYAKLAPLDRVCALASYGGHIEILQWAFQRKIPNTECYHQAAESGNTHVLNFLFENKCPLIFTTKACYLAAHGGHWETLKWLRDHGFPWDEHTCAFAARKGHFSLLKWAREQNCPWDETTCAYAAEMGHINIIQWALENGCLWDVRTITFAARKGRLDSIKYAHKKGCPMNETATLAASSFGHLHVLKWLIKKNCKFYFRKCLTQATKKKQLEVVKWLEDNYHDKLKLI
jgi:hypothetical protein